MICLMTSISSKNKLLKNHRILEITKTKPNKKQKERQLLDFLKNSAKTEEIFKLEKEMEEMDEEIEQNKSNLKRGLRRISRIKRESCYS